MTLRSSRTPRAARPRCRSTRSGYVGSGRPPYEADTRRSTNSAFRRADDHATLLFALVVQLRHRAAWLHTISGVNEHEDGGRGRRWRPIFLVVAGVVIVLLGVASYGWYRDSRTTEFAYPEALVACRGSVTTACARRAAGRAGHEVAWLEAKEGFQSLGFVADGDDVVFQQLSGEGWFVTLYSSNVPPASGAVIPVTIAGTEGHAYLQAEDGTNATFSIEWEHGGRRYRAATAVEGSDPRTRLNEVTTALQDVSYSSP